MNPAYNFYPDPSRRPRGEYLTIRDEDGIARYATADGDGTAALLYSELWRGDHDGLGLADDPSTDPWSGGWPDPPGSDDPW
jgi:hypothetical protein